MTWTIPNILTLARLLAAPGVALAYAAFDRPAADWVAIVLFITAALTDYLDGRLADFSLEIANGETLSPGDFFL